MTILAAIRIATDGMRMRCSVQISNTVVQFHLLIAGIVDVDVDGIPVFLCQLIFITALGDNDIIV